MSEAKGEQAERQQLLRELEWLDAEQQRLDLRDQDAISECERRIQALRERINRLDSDRRLR